MTIKTRSKFYYDFASDNDSTDLVFNEGAADLTAKIRVGQYSPTNLAIETARALTETGAHDYLCTFNRESRLFTISASGSFSLLVTSGVTSSSAFPLLGFTGGDIVSVTSSTSDAAAGKVFLPQFRLQNFVDFQDDEGFSFATTNKTANAQVEVVSFGTESFSEFNIMFQTNIDQGHGGSLETDLNGVSNMREFFRYAIKKGSIDFMPDRDDVNAFTECILEKTPASKDGVAFKLKEMYSKGLIDYFESGLIKLRKL